jgi:hypothetical protein
VDCIVGDELRESPPAGNTRDEIALSRADQRSGGVPLHGFEG